MLPCVLLTFARWRILYILYAASTAVVRSACNRHVVRESVVGRSVPTHRNLRSTRLSFSILGRGCWCLDSVKILSMYRPCDVYAYLGQYVMHVIFAQLFYLQIVWSYLEL